MHYLIVTLAGLFAAEAAVAQAPAKPFLPMRAGVEARPDGWNGDGVPRPPAMWRGHGGDRWPVHYKACRQRYPGYDPRTDTYRRGSERVRCEL